MQLVADFKKSELRLSKKESEDGLVLVLWRAERYESSVPVWDVEWHHTGRRIHAIQSKTKLRQKQWEFVEILKFLGFSLSYEEKSEEIIVYVFSKS